ncbi:hypothetical protein BS78_07G222100 [Paspalum vaginatum]|nr:hypothetical protein BS78_07G222100 [Paspalum vaginatum]
MGCGHSKPKLRRGGARESAAVALCRDRSALLAEAIARRYALADAHRAYAASLCATGAALHDFLRAVQEATPEPDQALGLPAPRNNGDDADAPAPAPPVTAPTTLAPAASDAQEVDDDDEEDGHIHFCSDEGEAYDDGRGGISPDDEPDGLEPTLPRTERLKQETPAPAAPPPQPPQMAAAPYSSAYRPPPQVPSHYSFDYPPPPYRYSGYGPVPGSAYGYGGGYEANMGGGSRQSSYDISYTQSHPPPSMVSYHQDQGPHVTDATIRYHYYQGQGQSDGIPSFHSSRNGEYSYQYYSPSQQSDGWPPVSTSSSHQLPLPSPPMESAWGFLDPFEPLERYYLDHPAYPAAQSSNGVGDEDEDMPELEEDEDIPELEDEECSSSTTLSEDEEHHIEFKESSSDATTSSSTRSSTVHGNAVEEDNNAVEEQLEEHSGVAEAEQPLAAAPEKMYNNDVEVVQEIKLQFEHASKSADDVCKMLEVGKMPHSQKNSRLKVSSMIWRVPSMSKKFIKFEEEKAMECGNLSSSLQQLYWWEKKLLQEVKSTEKIRVLHDEKCKTLKKLYDNGAEAHKLEEVEVSIKKLSSKLDISIRIVNNISYKINKMRDQELWPQTHKVIQGFMQMWDAMSECHQIQCHAMSQARNIDSIVAATKFSESLMDLVKKLELQLLDMTTCFATWFSAQKRYASTLNEWLKRGIMYEPEVTDDGVAPFSPGRLGAPPVFTIYNNWATILGRISDAEVVGSMHALASNVLGIWEKHMSEWRKVVLAHSMDLDKDLRAMDKDDMWMRRAVEARNKNLVLISGQGGVPVSSAQAVHEDAPPPAEDGLQLCMTKVFEAMGSFTTACRNAYKDLRLCSEEERVSFATAICVDADKDLRHCSGEEETRIAAACAMNAGKDPPHIRTSEDGAASVGAACTTNDPQLRCGEEEKEKAASKDEENGSAPVPEIQTPPAWGNRQQQQHKA